MSTTASLQFLKKNINNSNNEEIIYPITLTSGVFRIQGLKKISLEDELLKLDNIFNANSGSGGKTPLKNVNVDCANGINEIHNLPYESLSQIAKDKINQQISTDIISQITITNPLEIKASDTLKMLTQKDGKISLTTQNINISTNQISDFKANIDDKINANAELLTSLKQQIGIDDEYPGINTTIRQDIESRSLKPITSPVDKHEEVELAADQLYIVYEEQNV